VFESQIYIERRTRLKQQIGSGLILLLGNDESPMNYADNCYPFRQDSTFLYFFGLDTPALAVVIDAADGNEIIFGDDPTIDDIIWIKAPPPINEQAAKTGVTNTAPSEKLTDYLNKAVAENQKIHILPPYRPANIIKLQKLLPDTEKYISPDLIRAVAAQRSYKSAIEIERIEISLDIAYQMHIKAMEMTKPGVHEKQVAAAIEQTALDVGGRMSFPIIFSADGQIMHNIDYCNILKEGDIVVNDSGAECPMHYASDITRTIPVGGKFTQRQKDIYSIVFSAQQKAIDAIKPGVEFRDIHLLACKVLAAGLKDMGLMKGDTEQAVAAGAHALFFQCGLGHMMGLDAHDMEDLGEDYFGYTDKIKRNPQFGLRSLRLGKELEPGFVITVEPGLYFIPQLIDLWQSQKKHADFINYTEVQKFRTFKGIRLEDDILVTKTASRLLGKPIPKTIKDVEAIASS
jgi:Xaa-Pro aminopeptidase